MSGTKQKITHYLDNILDYIVCIYMTVIFVVLPLYFKDGYRTIASDKCEFYINISVIFILIVSIFLFLRRVLFFFVKKDDLYPKIKNRLSMMSRLDWFMVLYAISAIFSYLFSEFKLNAFLGTDGWYMGTITQLIFVAVYFLVSRIWKRHKFNWIIAFPVSFVVFLLGFLNRFGAYPIDMGESTPAFISTIGNINWFCGYMVITLFFCIGILWQSYNFYNYKKILNALLWLYTFVGFLIFPVQGSDTALLSLASVFLTMFYLSASDSEKMEKFVNIFFVFSMASFSIFILRNLYIIDIKQSEHYLSAEVLTDSIVTILFAISSIILMIMINKAKKNDSYDAVRITRLSKRVVLFVIAAIILLLIFIVVNTLCGGSIIDDDLFIFSEDWGSHRGADWKIACMCFFDQNMLHKIFGVGPDCMTSYIYTGGNVEILNKVTETFGRLRLTNAHNEFLTILVNEGILGLISYAGIFVVAIREFLKNKSGNRIVLACGLCLIAYVANSLLSFQNIMNTPFLFMFLGIGENFCRNHRMLENKTRNI